MITKVTSVGLVLFLLLGGPIDGIAQSVYMLVVFLGSAALFVTFFFENCAGRFGTVSPTTHVVLAGVCCLGLVLLVVLGPTRYASHIAVTTIVAVILFGAIRSHRQARRAP